MATTNSKLRLVPVTGKFCQVNFGGKKYEIWRRLPGTERTKGAPVGTAIDYNIAVQLLCLQPPVVALVPKVEDGKFVAQVKESDLALIKEAQTTGQSMISNAFNNLSAPEADTSNDSEVIAALKAQNQALQDTMKAQKEASDAQFQALSAQFEAFKAQFSAQSGGDAAPAPEGKEQKGK